MREFIDSTATNARRNAEYKISDMIQGFKVKLAVEVGNLVNKQGMKESRDRKAGHQAQDGPGAQKQPGQQP